MSESGIAIFYLRTNLSFHSSMWVTVWNLTKNVEFLPRLVSMVMTAGLIGLVWQRESAEDWVMLQHEVTYLLWFQTVGLQPMTVFPDWLRNRRNMKSHSFL